MTHRRRFDLVHAQLMDIDRAMALLRRLQPKAYEAATLVGILGYSTRTAAALAGVSSPQTMSNRYRHAITTMTDYLNLGRRT